jgi:hypothetical protein
MPDLETIAKTAPESEPIVKKVADYFALGSLIAIGAGVIGGAYTAATGDNELHQAIFKTELASIVTFYISAGIAGSYVDDGLDD